LVSGGAPALAPGDVAVVMIAHPAPAGAASANPLTRIGPLVVSRGSKRLLEVGLPMTAALVSAFFWLLYYTRFSRLRAETASGDKERAER
ncbi:MAG TPA: hypothetical protein VNO21_00615, partial [Polyangiaceae bacterium]|nr:hypothetical protein [Polyangiaceae bacterium]